MKINNKILAVSISLLMTTVLSACQKENNHQKIETKATVVQPDASSKSHSIEVTVKDAENFIMEAEKTLADMTVYSARTAWLQSNFINTDSMAVAARANRDFTAITVKMANEARKYNKLDLPAELHRKMEALKLALTLPAPMDEAKNAELAEITSYLEGAYGAGKYCPETEGSECKDLGQLSNTIATSKDPAELLEAWQGWRTIAKPMRKRYIKMVELANEGAKDLGYKDLGAMWRSKYDMKPDAFATEMDRVWTQVKPLYNSLHCYVRDQLNTEYGDEIVSKTGAIPAHLLGNMWAQSWGNVYDSVKPETDANSLDLTKILHENGYTFKEGDRKGELEAAKKMVSTAENFFVSLGFEKLPATFWERSLFIKPQDREVVCHASAWDIDNKDDLRIKMCIKMDAEDFSTIHHELGHNFYQRAYKDQSPLFQGSANDGFHEAAGDLIALSITPEYLKKIGLIEELPKTDNAVPQLLRQALDKVAFLPFGLMVDKWRWQVFSGEVDSGHYNEAWWKLREQYQGVKAPTARTEDDFDPGAKYHIPGNTPYARYFLAHILEFQWHRDLCRSSGYKGPLHLCSIYGDKEAGAKIKKMFEMGASKPWPEALAVIGGSGEMDATAVIEYFEPLKTWLDGKNQGKSCGW